jgi:hypothetical protein
MSDVQHQVSILVLLVESLMYPVNLIARTHERIFSKMNIYVGNLPYELTNDELKDVFQQYGEVSSVNIITDKMTGRSKVRFY